MPKEDFTKQVLERIEKEQITPRPRWQFVAKNYAIWGIGIIAIALGAATVGVGIFHITNVGLPFYRIMHSPDARLFFASLPFLWMIVFGGFLLVADYYLRHTDGGYRYTLSQITGGVLLVSVVAGIGCYVFGVGYMIDHTLERHVPGYIGVMHRGQMIFNNPDAGILSGTIVQIYDDRNLLLEDPEMHIWNVALATTTRGTFVMGMPIRFIGEQTQEREFFACRVLRPGFRGRGVHGAMMGREENERLFFDVRSTRCEEISTITK